jgi:hypothetical protein
MENLVNKWKKMMNNEKEKFERSERSDKSESNNKKSPRKKSTERNLDFKNQDMITIITMIMIMSYPTKNIHIIIHFL